MKIWNNLSKITLSTMALSLPAITVQAGSFDSSANSCCEQIPICCDAGNWIATADYLYWKAEQEGLEYALDANSGVKDPDFNFSSGFRVGLGYQTSQCWNVYVNYTYYRNHNGKSRAKDTQGLEDLFSTYAIADDAVSGGTPLDAASSKWKLPLYETLDLEFSRTKKIDPYFMLRPHFGLRGSWQRQTLNTTHVELALSDAEEIMNQKARFRGLGIRAGLDMTWQFTCHWSLFGDVSSAAVWHHVKVARDDNRVSISGEKEQIWDLSNSYHTVKPMFEYAIGLRWEDHFGCRNEYHWLLQAGWQETVWVNMNQFIGLSNGEFDGDLTLHGLTVTTRFDF